jgi:hypothetical protein
MRRFTNKREEWEDTTVWQEIEEEEDRKSQEADMEGGRMEEQGSGPNPRGDYPRFGLSECGACRTQEGRGNC